MRPDRYTINEARQRRFAEHAHYLVTTGRYDSIFLKGADYKFTITNLQTGAVYPYETTYGRTDQYKGQIIVYLQRHHPLWRRTGRAVAALVRTNDTYSFTQPDYCTFSSTHRVTVTLRHWLEGNPHYQKDDSCPT